jgi:hypothetical protein
MEKSSLLDVAIAPLTLLERSRGRKRQGLILLYLIVLTLVGVLGWRELSLWRLPSLKEPFDEAKLGVVTLPDDDNAMTWYRAAALRLKPLDGKVYLSLPKDAFTVGWSKVDPALVRWLEENRDVFDFWLRGADRTDSLVFQPKDMTIATNLGVVQNLRDFGRLAMLEGSRLQDAGDLDGAWRIYRGAVRSSRHAGIHGAAIQRLIGRSLLVQARPRVLEWIESPKVTPEMLRRAIADVEACSAMTPPNSDMIRAEYFALRAALNRPEEWNRYIGGEADGPGGAGMWYNHLSFVPPIRRFLLREPERSLRVLRLVTAGVLAQCDRPRASRAKLIEANYLIYDVDDRTPAVVASMTPEELKSWADRSTYRYLMPALNTALSYADFEGGTFDELRLRMAERAYEIERGKPASTYGDLLGPYLRSLPENIEPADQITAPAEPK